MAPLPDIERIAIQDVGEFDQQEERFRARFLRELLEIIEQVEVSSLLSENAALDLMPRSLLFSSFAERELQVLLQKIVEREEPLLGMDIFFRSVYALTRSSPGRNIRLVTEVSANNNRRVHVRSPEQPKTLCERDIQTPPWYVGAFSLQLLYEGCPVCKEKLPEADPMFCEEADPSNSNEDLDRVASLSEITLASSGYLKKTVAGEKRSNSQIISEAVADSFLTFACEEAARALLSLPLNERLARFLRPQLIDPRPQPLSYVQHFTSFAKDFLNDESNWPSKNELISFYKDFFSERSGIKIDNDTEFSLFLCFLNRFCPQAIEASLREDVPGPGFPDYDDFSSFKLRNPSLIPALG